MTPTTVPEITAEEAKRRLQGPERWIYLDVRTVAEFVAGHPPGAWNVPVAEVNPALGRMEFNESFLEVVGAALPKDARILVGCRSGGRSEMACRVMLDAGYRDVVNVHGGFAGMENARGEIVVEGWSTLGFPIERGLGGEKGYEALQSKGKPSTAG
jgi:rhodanese-related sulfurtransferase